MSLKAQWAEESYETIINGTAVRRTDRNISGKENISNLYSDLPLLVKTENGYVVISAHAKGLHTIPDRKDPYVYADLLSEFVYDDTAEMSAVYLEARDTDRIDEEIVKDVQSRNYTIVEGSGFDLNCYKETSSYAQRESHVLSGKIRVTVDLKKLGIKLKEAPYGIDRTYYLAHNSNGDIEYLPVSLSSGRNEATFQVDHLSPFAFVCRDEKKSDEKKDDEKKSPSDAEQEQRNGQPDTKRRYVLPVTGIE